MTNNFLNIAAYKFVPIDDLNARRERLLEFCQQRELKGTILLSTEGLNVFVAGRPDSARELVSHLRDAPEFADLGVKESFSEHQPFNRMLVRIKKEIIAFSVNGIEPGQRTSQKISPTQLQSWIEEGRDFTLLDVRNDYEIALGTFNQAVPVNIDHFRNFPAAVEKLSDEMRNKPVVMFCTGGIRCEKAGPFMEADGFQDVFQLEGGILKYFEEVGGKHYRGECFVFDKRVALNPELEETETSQCYACQLPLTAEDQMALEYVPGISCPYCFKPVEVRQAETIAWREKQISEFTNPLPGSIPYANIRPLNVPGKFDQTRLIDYLCECFPQLSKEWWLEEIASRRILKQGGSCRPDQRVRGGERLDHLFPETVEPDVNANIKILHEDEALVVVDKPAPIPMHPSGRFNRNTMSFILDEIYKPQYLREVHRLDAQTTGIVVYARTRKFATCIHAQFKDRSIGKSYFAKVLGHPPSDEFDCDFPIQRQSGLQGVRRAAEEILDEGSGVLDAFTRFVVLQRRDDRTSIIRALPETGRTNQIRIHLWSLGFPIVGDPVYLPHRATGTAHEISASIPPLCLHSSSIELCHPVTNERVTYSAPDPNWLRDS